MTTWWRRAGTALALASAATTGAAAQAQDTTTARPDTVRLGELSVSATRLPVSANAVTASVSVIDGETLRRRGIHFVSDALRELPSAAVVQGGGRGGVGALFLRGGESDYVKVLVDGVPLNEPGGAVNLANLATANVERIEVVRGPVSVLYGADAVAGLVQIFTRRGDGPASARLSVEGGSRGTLDWTADAAGGAGRVDWSAAASRYGTDGIYDFNSRYRNTVVSGRLGARPDLFSDVALTGRYTDSRYHFPTDFAGIPADSNQYSTQRQLAAGVDAGRWVTPALEARVIAGIVRTENGFDDQADHAGDAGYGFRSERETVAWRRTADARVNVRTALPVVFTVGTQFEDEREEVASVTESDFGEGPFVETTSFEESRQTLGVYAQAIADLPSGLALTLNARYDDNSAFGGFTTARAGAAYRLRTGTRLRASFGTAYKAPTFCELYCDQPFIVGSADLRPEETATWEVGVEQLVAGGLGTVSATWFSQRFRNRIEYVAAEAGEPNYVNLGRARARGLEVAASASPHPAVELGVAYTWLDTEITDDGGTPNEGLPLLRRPKHTLSARAVVSPVERVTASLSVIRVGARDDTDFGAGGVRGELSAYVTTDASMAFRVRDAAAGAPGITVTVRAENLFDASFEQTFGFPGRRRAVFAGASLSL